MTDQGAKMIRNGLLAVAVAIVLFAVVMKWPRATNSLSISPPDYLNDKHAVAVNRDGSVYFFNFDNKRWQRLSNPIDESLIDLRR